MTKRRKKSILSAVTVVLFIAFGFKLTHPNDEQVVDPKVDDRIKERSNPAPPVNDETKEEVELVGSEVEKAQEIEEDTEEDTEEVPVEEEIQEQEHLPDEESLVQNEEEPEAVEVVESTENDNTEEETAEQPKSEVRKEVVPSSGVGMTEYLLPNANSEERVENTTHVMLHFTSNALNNPQDPYRIEDTYNIFRDYEVSAHYVIGRAGEIYLFVPENRVAYHAGRGQLSGYPEYTNRLNHYSIGIELLAIGTREEMTPIISAEVFDQIDPAITGYTEAQYHALNTLLNDIVGRHPHIHKNRNQIIGHDEYSGSKTDPGSLFDWSKIGL